MAEFRAMVITNSGQELIAKTLAGELELQFTKICLTDTAYTDAQLLELSTLNNICQSASISRVSKTSESAIQVEGVVLNVNLTTGYYIQTLGLFAKDLNNNEVLYAACGATIPGWMPPYNGSTISGCNLKLITMVSNTSNISLTVDPAAIATIEDLNSLELSSIQTVDGLHGIRYYNNALEVKNNTGNWINPASLATAADLNSLELSSIQTVDGLHGIRYYNNALEVKNNTGNWINPASLAMNDEVNALKPKSKTLTLSVSNWVLNSNTQLYEYTVTDSTVSPSHIINCYMDLDNQVKLTDGYTETYNGSYKIITSKQPIENITITVTKQLYASW